jgi:hypothetical protein
MPSSLPTFVLGYHGCDQEVATSVLLGKTKHIEASENDYDWLGHGSYFWEGSPQRAWEFAQQAADSPQRGSSNVKTPAVLGAIIDLRRCLNLLDSESIEVLRNAHDELRSVSCELGLPMPENKDTDGSGDFLLRYLDCAVVECLHETRNYANSPAYDTVRGLFAEGPPLYEGAGFHERTHIQVCVRNTDCIVGYFRPTWKPD